MGQYYKAIILEEKVKDAPTKVKTWMYSHDYGNGLKLMEHSYLKNPYVQAFEFQLSPEGQHHKSRVVWGGDYADEETDQTVTTPEEDLNEGEEAKEYHPTLYG